jgi:hypothetical protein
MTVRLTGDDDVGDVLVHSYGEGATLDGFVQSSNTDEQLHSSF